MGGLVCDSPRSDRGGGEPDRAGLEVLGERVHGLTSGRTVVSVTFCVEDPLGRVALRTQPVGNCHTGCQPAALGAL